MYQSIDKKNTIKPGGDKPLFKLGAFESFLAGAGVVILINIVLLLQGDVHKTGAESMVVDEVDGRNDSKL